MFYESSCGMLLIFCLGFLGMMVIVRAIRLLISLDSEDPRAKELREVSDESPYNSQERRSTPRPKTPSKRYDQSDWVLN